MKQEIDDILKATLDQINPFTNGELEAAMLHLKAGKAAGLIIIIIIKDIYIAPLYHNRDHAQGANISQHSGLQHIDNNIVTIT